MAISQLLLGAANSNLVSRKSKCSFIIKFSLLLSIRLCWRKIRPYAGKTTLFVVSFLSIDYPEKRFRETSCTADEQACVFGSCAFSKYPVLNSKQAGLFAVWYGPGRADSASPLSNFCLNGPIDLKFGM